MKTFLIKRIFILIYLVSTAGILYAQAPGTWRTYRAYQNATIVAQTPTKVFASYNGAVYDRSIYDDPNVYADTTSDGSLLSYSLEDNEIKLYSKADGLNDVNITQLGYNNESKALVIIYSNSNIDIFTNDDIYNLPFIKDNVYIQDKTINNLEFIGTEAYVSTAFGITVIDLKKKEIKATYNIEKSTKSVCIFKEYIYAATNKGVFRALLTSNLLDKNNWILYPMKYSYSQENISKLLTFNNSLIFYDASPLNPGMYYLDENENVINMKRGILAQITILNNQLVTVDYISSEITFYSDLQNKTTLEGIQAQYISSLNSQNTYWIAQGMSGISSFQKEANSSNYKIMQSDITVNSPKRNWTYSLTYSQNKLLVVGGGRGIDRFLRPGTLMVLENGNWFNFNEKEISMEAKMQCRDFVSAVVDPLDPNHYFVATWGEGIYEFKNNKYLMLFNEANSTLKSAVGAKPHADWYVRTSGLAFDKDNNLYALNTTVERAINIYTADKKWINYKNDQLSDKDILGDLLITKNQKWVNIPRTGPGIFVLEDKGTINTTSDDTTFFASNFYDQEGRDISITGFFCMSEDLNGTVWAGTDKGPITLSRSTDRWTCIRPKVPKNDGTNYADFLLDGQKITAIAVDGGNRKWIGTEGSGLFLVSPTGEEVLEYFTTENSLLISDIINSIAINDETGEVFVATDKGLVSYMGDAITGKPDYSNVYAFPNPVRAELDGQVIVTGLIKDSNVKITDLSGNLMIQGKSVGGQFTWNCRNQNGQIVRSGIYLVLSSTMIESGKTGESVVTKIVVVR